MMAGKKNKSFDERLVKYGKPKAIALYVAFRLLILSVLTVIHSLIVHHNLYSSFTKNVSFILFAMVVIVIESLRFYDDAIIKIKKAEELRLKGLTPADIYNINFVSSWKERKDSGFYKYILFNGGALLGPFIFLVLSFVFFPAAPPEGRQFPEFSDMISYMVKCYVVGFLSGMMLCAINWHINERKFKRLTAANVLEA